MSPSLSDIEALSRQPVTFVEEMLGGKLWGKQQEIAQSLVDNRTTAVRSCHGSGKTHLSARLALWWLFTRPYSAVITTAPTSRQVTELLWKEIRVAYKNARTKLGGDLLPRAAKLTVDDDWLCIGFSTDDPVNFQGWHSPGGTLAIFDEAPGVDSAIWETIEGVLVGDRDRHLVIGNPVEPSGPFFEIFNTSDPSIAKFHISAYDVPNVVEDEEVFPGLCTKGWVESRKEAWGEGSPMWTSRVLGDFPDVDDFSLVPLSWFEAAVARWHSLNETNGWKTEINIGADVARLGEDRTIFAIAHEDLGVREIERKPKSDTMETTGSIIRAMEDYAAQNVRIDADGIGAGVYDRLCEIYGDYARDYVCEMRGGMRSELDPARYRNRRAEWYWTLRERLDPRSDAPLALPPDDKLRGQLTSIRWKTDSQGRIGIESKDDMRARGMKSPDEADAVAYAVALMPHSTFVFV